MKTEHRLQIEDLKHQLGRSKSRAVTAEKSNKLHIRRAEEEKEMTAVAEQHAGDTAAMLAAARQSLQEPDAKKVVESCVASVQTEATSRRDAQMEETTTQTDECQEVAATEVKQKLLHEGSLKGSHISFQASNGEIATAKEVLSWLEELLHEGSLKRSHISCQLFRQRLRFKAEEYAKKAVAVAPQEMVQGAGKVCYGAVWRDFTDDEYERRLVYTYLSGRILGIAIWISVVTLSSNF